MAKSRKTTVTLALDISTICACGEFLSQKRINVKAQPISTTVRTTLEAMMTYFASRGVVNDYEKFDTDQLLQTYQDMFKLSPVDLGMDHIVAEDILNLVPNKQEGEQLAEIIEDSIAERAAQARTDMELPDIGRSTDETETDDIPEIRFNVYALDRPVNIETLLKDDPDDPILQRCMEEECPELLKACVEAVYYQAEVNGWKTDVIKATIDLYHRAHDGSPQP